MKQFYQNHPPFNLTKITFMKSKENRWHSILLKNKEKHHKYILNIATLFMKLLKEIPKGTNHLITALDISQRFHADVC